MSADRSRNPPGSDRAPLIPERALAWRWEKSRRTLQRWRAEDRGPPFLRIGGSVFYREDDVVAYENRMRRGGESRQ